MNENFFNIIEVWETNKPILVNRRLVQGWKLLAIQTSDTKTYILGRPSNVPEYVKPQEEIQEEKNYQEFLNMLSKPKAE